MTASSILTCEACKRSPVVERVDSFCPQQPFQLCRECAHRLRTYSLRPLEYFNLAATHTFYEYYLHDDFYDEDGTACQPQEEVVNPDAFPAPTLDATSDDPEKLLDYAFSRWYFKEDLIRALRSQEQSVLVRSLTQRVSKLSNSNIEARAFEICAVLGTSAELWIRQKWQSYKPETLALLIQATANCLPASEGFSLAVEALENTPLRQLPDNARALSYFQSETTLDWIEKHISSPCTHWWGRLAAVSKLSWKRVSHWLDAGRLLSLVALDGLNFFGHYDTPLLKQIRPKLLHPESRTVMTTKLKEYASKDPVPRVQRAVHAAISHWNEICGQTSEPS